MRIHPFALVLSALCVAWIPSPVRAHGDGAVSEGALGPHVRRDLATLRAATAPYHDFDAAIQPGLWEVPVPNPLECLESPAGGMGYHFVRPEYFGTLDPGKPQALIYEPEQDGSMRLVAVEYIVPGSPGDTPPMLMGQTFHYVERFGIWALHAWVWRHNPSGIFADWNSNVSCRYAF